MRGPQVRILSLRPKSRIRPHESRKVGVLCGFNIFNVGVVLMPNGNDVIFMTRSFWDEMSIPKSIVQNSYNKFLGHENCLIDSRAQAIDWLTQILSVLKEELIQWLKKTDSNQVIISSSSFSHSSLVLA